MKNDKKQILKGMIKKDGKGGPGIIGGIKNLLSSTATVDKNGPVQEPGVLDKFKNMFASSPTPAIPKPEAPKFTPATSGPGALDFGKFDTANKTLDMNKTKNGLTSWASPPVINTTPETQQKINLMKDVVKSSAMPKGYENQKLEAVVYKPRPDLNVNFTDAEAKELKAAMYSEMGFRKDKMELEAATIANSLLNDMAVNKASSTLSSQLNKDRVQGIGTAAYNAYKSGEAHKATSETTRARIAAIDKIVDKMQKGELTDNIGGYRQYSHIYRDENGEFGAQDTVIKPYKDYYDQNIDAWKFMSSKDWNAQPKWQKKQWIEQSKKERAEYIKDPVAFARKVDQQRATRQLALRKKGR